MVSQRISAKKGFVVLVFTIIVLFSTQKFLLYENRKVNPALSATPKSNSQSPTKVTEGVTESVGITSDQLIVFGKINSFPNGVPKIVHYNYKDVLVPSQYIPLVEKCIQINPGVKFVIWSDLSALNLIKNKFPKNLETYNSYLLPGSDPLKKSDIIRYFILYHFGGIYMDLDTRCQRPMEEAMRRESCILSREAEVQTRVRWNSKYSAMNSFMICVPNHEFFGYLIKSLRKDDNSAILWITGPAFLTEVFDKYNATMNVSDVKKYPQKYISVSSSDQFSPQIETFLEGFCKNPSGEWKVRGCKDLVEYRKKEKQKVSEAIVVHLFYHLGYAFAHHLIKSLKDISKIKGISVMI